MISLEITMFLSSYSNLATDCAIKKANVNLLQTGNFADILETVLCILPSTSLNSINQKD